MKAADYLKPELKAILQGKKPTQDTAKASITTASQNIQYKAADFLKPELKAALYQQSKTPDFGDATTLMSKQAAVDSYNKMATDLAQPNVQFAMAGLPQPTQTDLNSLYARRDELTKQQRNPYNDDLAIGNYAEQINEINRQIESISKVVPNAQLRSNTPYLDRAMRGLSSTMQTFATTALKNPLFPTTQVANIIKNTTGIDVAQNALDTTINKDVEWENKRIAANQETMGKEYDILGSLVEGTAAALPQAALAIATGGVSATTALPALGGNAGLGTAITSGLSKMVQSPLFAASFGQTYGASYNQAIASGASEDEAQLTATLVGLINSAVELTGGLETLPTALKSGNINAVKEWVTSALSEGKEEVVQGIIERLTNKAIYNPDAPLYSTTNPDAVFNYKNYLQEGLSGAAIGGILGGGQVATQSAIDSILNSKAQQTAQPSQTNVQPTAQNTVLNTDSNTTATPKVESAVKNLPTVESNVDAKQNPPITNIPTTQATQATGEAGKVIDGFDSSVSSAAQEVKSLIDSKIQSKKASLNGIMDAMISMTNGKTNVEDYSSAFSELFSNNQYAVNANNEVYKVGDSEYIDDRTFKSVGDKKVNSFQFDNPAVHQYYADAARGLISDLNQSVRGERFGIKDSEGYYTDQGVGIKRSTIPEIERLLDNAKLSYADIRKALEAIQNDKGQENYAAAKRVELILDDILTNGYTTIDGIEVEPSQEYINLKQKLSQTQPTMPEGMGAASKGMDAMGTLVEQYGALPSGALNAEDRVIEFAKQSSDGKYISKTAQSAAEATATPATLAQDIEDAAAKGYWSFDKNTDKGAISRGVGKITTDGYWQSVKDFAQTVADGKVSKDDIVLGQLLYVHAANAGDGQTATQILTDLVTMQRFGAQATQAAFILKKLSPQWQLYSVEQMTQKMNERLNKTNKNFKMTKQQSEEADTAAKKMSNAVKEESKKAADDVTKELQDGIDRLAKKVENTTKLAEQKAPDFMTDMVNELFKSAKESPLPEKASASKRNPIEFLTQAIQNKADYTDMWEQAKQKLLDKYADNPEVMDMLKAYFEKGIVPTYSQATLKASIKQALDDLDMKLKDIKELSWQDRQDAIKKIREYLIEQTGAMGKDAIQLSSDVTSKVTQMIIDSAPKLTQKAKEDIKLATQDAMRNHGIAVESWASETGRLLAESISKKMTPQQPKAEAITDTIMKDIRAFVGKINTPKSQNATRNAIDRFTDFMNNKEYYSEAWGRLRSELRQKYAGNVGAMMALDNILNGNLQASAETYLDKQLATMTTGILKDIGVKISDMIDQNSAAKSDIISKISELLISKYNVEKDVATQISEKVSTRLAEIIQERSLKRLTAMFPVKVDDPKAKKSIEDKLAKLINLGAFDSTQFNSLAAERLFNIKGITVSPDLANKFVQAKTDAERKAALKEIYSNIAEQIPPTPFEKFNAWRYMSMLINPLTHLRNIYSNTVFRSERFFRNMMSIGITNAYNKAAPAINSVFKTDLKQIERTRAILTRADKALIEACRNDYENAVEEIYRFGKYDDAANQIEDERKIFGRGGKTVVGNFLSNTVGKAVEGARQGNTRLLTGEDGWVTRPAYTKALASYLKAHNATLESASQELLTEARTFAIKEAKEASYRDSNDFSDFVASLGKNYTGDNKIAKAANMAVEGVLPFKRTPANVARQGFRFSPLGLLKTVTIDGVKLRRGEITASEFIDNLSAGLTGTALYGLGMLLARWGVIEIVGGGDDKEDALEKTQGKKAYALNVFGANIPIDFLATVSMPMFMGAKTYDILTTKRENGITLQDALSIASDVTGPILETSMLSSIDDFLENFSWAKQNNINLVYYAVVQAATSYLGQYVPSIGGSIARTIDPTRRTYFTDKTSGIPTDLQYFMQRQIAKIPFASSKLEPFVDQWGRTQQPGTVENIANNWINPFRFSKVNVSPMEEELQRLYTEYAKDNEVNVLPPATVSKTFSNDGEDVYMNAKEYTQYKITSGQYAYSELTKLTQSSAYKKMNDEKKAEAVADVWEAAREKAKTEVMEIRGEMRLPSVTDSEKLQDYMDSGLSQEKAYALYKAIDTLDLKDVTSSEAKYQKITTVLKQQIPQTQKVSLVAQYFTEHDKDGNVTKESLLPSLKNSDRLIALYSQTKDSQMVSMAIPESVVYKSTTYELSASDRRLFKETYLKAFNAYMTPTISAEEVAKLRDIAYEQAKMTVLQKKLS